MIQHAIGKIRKNILSYTIVSITFFLVNYSYSQTIVPYSKLKEKENKLFIGNELFSGLVLKTFLNNQPKSISEVRDGVIDGKVIEFIEEKSYKSRSYLDTFELNKLINQLNFKKKELELAIQDTVKATKSEKDYIDNEIGGFEKLQKLKGKYVEGKLNKNKKEIYDKYEQLVKSRIQSNRMFNEIQAQIKGLEDDIKYENAKPHYIPIRYIEYNLLNGLKEGWAIIYDSLGNKFGEGEFLNDKQNGIWSFYYPNGKKLAKGKFIMGNGEDKGASGVPKNGREGEWLFYFQNGKLEEQLNYKNGLLEGTRKVYFENGNLSQESNYKNGLLEGVSKVYYKNGNIELLGSYFKDKATGKWMGYYENGNVKEEANLVNGEKNGINILYDENGKLTAEAHFIDNLANGVFKTYYSNGNIKEIGKAHQGKFTVEKKFNPDGSPFKSEWFIKQDEYTSKKEIFSYCNSPSGSPRFKIIGKSGLYYRWNLFEKYSDYLYFSEEQMYKYSGFTAVWYIKVNGVSKEFKSEYNNVCFIPDHIFIELKNADEVTIKIANHPYYFKFSLAGFNEAIEWLNQ